MMDAITVLKYLTENLTEKKSICTLSNYTVLTNNIKFLNEALLNEINNLEEFQVKIEKNFQMNKFVLPSFNDDSKKEFYFKTLIPRILFNDLKIIKKFYYYSHADNRIKNKKLQKNFVDYNNLLTSTRQILDSLTMSSYQFIKLDSKEINYQILTSLSSFNSYTTRSINKNLFPPAVQNILLHFEKLNYNEKKGKESSFTKCDKITFNNKIDMLSEILKIKEKQLIYNIKKLYKFSSEFTHIGYTSSLFTDTNFDVIFKDEIGIYYASTENFNELKYEILETVINFLINFYLPSIKCLITKSFEITINKKLQKQLDTIIQTFYNKLQTRNNQYYFFITDDLINMNKSIPLTCKCGQTIVWNYPYDEAKLFCKKCGSKFNIIQLSGNPDYICTDKGPCRVIGSNVPILNSLSPKKYK